MRCTTMPPSGRTARRSGLAQVLGYWQGLCRGRPLPARRDLDPGALRPWLPQAGLVARAPDGGLRFRLGGSGLEALAGVDLRGLPFRSVFDVGARPRLAELTEAVFEGPSVLTLGAYGGVRAPLAADMLLLPLSDEAGEITRALFYVEPSGSAGHRAQSPCRFRIGTARLIRLSQPSQNGPPLAGGPVLRVIRGGRAAAPA